MFRSVLILFFFLCIALTSFGQGGDSTVESSVSNPSEESLVLNRKKPAVAGLLSAVVPGAGQIYNGSYWKTPIVYAGVGALIYYINDFNRRTNFYHEVLKLIDVDSSKTYIASYVDAYPNVDRIVESGVNGTVVALQSETQIKQFYDSNRTRLQNTYIFSVVWYGLNILAAVVDAHLKNFDVSDDLTLKVSPELWRTGGVGMASLGGGVQLTFSLK